ncbi:hypothetical protein NBRC110019_21880 [Neptunitalea chrysea]|uniref:Uncharacterized protein n=1 Tax=Neptunitalea chrysea TaxID=1647581 RepID=A0A9W6B5R8_9FLAO|nr:hypothetical protein [Neptunitalea chrysea]GLB53148.1 hypothetical protein NBRC110019_21880 [Neptunitalea chrysea]
MSNNVTVLGILFLGIFIGPILYLALRERKKSKGFTNQIKQIASQYNLSGCIPEEVGHLVFLIDKENRRGLVFDHHSGAENYLEFDKKHEASLSASYENETLEDGKSIISKIILTLKNANISKQFYAFDETYPNQLHCKHIVEQAKNMVYQIHKL